VLPITPRAHADSRSEADRGYGRPSRSDVYYSYNGKSVGGLCDTEIVASADPKSVKVNLTTGTGVDIEWKDGHHSHYSFVFLRDACPCALCDEERGKMGRQPGERPKAVLGALPMFKEAAKPTSADAVGKYAIKFHWNDGHELGIYSWQFLRDWCPCEECKVARVTVKTG
jgi:DUF971 family protein